MCSTGVSTTVSATASQRRLGPATRATAAAMPTTSSSDERRRAERPVRNEHVDQQAADESRDQAVLDAHQSVAVTATTSTRSGVAPAIGISGRTVVSSSAASSAVRAAKGTVKKWTPSDEATRPRRRRNACGSIGRERRIDLPERPLTRSLRAGPRSLFHVKPRCRVETSCVNRFT